MTEKTIIKKSKEGVTLSCATDGASIGYRIFEDNVADSTLVRNIKTWDFFYLMQHNNKKKCDRTQTMERLLQWQHSS